MKENIIKRDICRFFLFNIFPLKCTRNNYTNKNVKYIALDKILYVLIIYERKILEFSSVFLFVVVAIVIQRFIIVVHLD